MNIGKGRGEKRKGMDEERKEERRGREGRWELWGGKRKRRERGRGYWEEGR